jgi:quercetin dioxygenase-like cupin family protein
MNRVNSFVAVVTALLPFTAFATPPSGILFNVNLNRATTLGPTSELGSFGHWQVSLQTNRASDFIIQQVGYDLGGYSGWHSHPGPVMITIKRGTATWYEGSDPDCTPHVYPAGTAFVEPTGAPHSVQNESDVEEMEINDAIILPVGEPQRIDEDQPVNCPNVP